MVKKQPNQTASLMIATNNDAIAYLNMGELNESYSLLSEAVATLQKMILEQEPPTKRRPVRYNFQWNDITSSNAEYIFESLDPSGLPFLFQRCLTVDMPRKRGIQAKQQLCPIGLCSILHYNLALVAHLLGIQKAEYGKSYLQEANMRYGVVAADVQSRRWSSADYTVLIMGIWNNRGCIYMELGMEKQATHCLDLLRKILMSTKASRNQLKGWRYFYLNLITLEKPRSTATAA